MHKDSLKDLDLMELKHLLATAIKDVVAAIATEDVEMQEIIPNVDAKDLEITLLLLHHVIAAVLMIIHFWRVRKDGGISGPL